MLFRDHALRHPRDRARLAAQFQDVHAGIGAVDHVDVAAVVGLDVVALDRDLAAVLALHLDAALFSRLGDRRNEVADFPWAVGVAEVDGAYSRVEPGDESELLVENRRHALIGRMRSEPSAAG